MSEIGNIFLAFFLVKGVGWLFRIIWWILIAVAIFYAFIYIILPLVCLVPVSLGVRYDINHQKASKASGFGALTTAVLFFLYFAIVIPWINKPAANSPVHRVQPTQQHRSYLPDIDVSKCVPGAGC